MPGGRATVPVHTAARPAGPAPHGAALAFTLTLSVHSMTDREAEEVGCSPGSPPQQLTRGSQSPQRRRKGSPLGGPWLRGSMSQPGQVGAPGEAGICSPLMRRPCFGVRGPRTGRPGAWRGPRGVSGMLGPEPRPPRSGGSRRSPSTAFEGEAILSHRPELNPGGGLDRSSWTVVWRGSRGRPAEPRGRL